MPFDNRVLVTFAAGDSLVPFAAEERRFAFAAGRNLMVEEFAAEERRFAFTTGRNLMVEEFAADMGQVVAFVDNPYHLDIK